MAKWLLYTDGACQPNPGAGGWAFILQNGDSRIVRRGIVPRTTNNRMEIQAVLEGLRYFILEIGTEDNSLKLFSDSKYLVQGITEWCDKWASKGWVKHDENPVLNQSFWKELRVLKGLIQLECVHVKGHAGDDLNEQVDALAVEAAFKAKQFYGEDV
jgi:ribonuclease HI